jgi:hypothetical protein
MLKRLQEAWAMISSIVLAVSAVVGVGWASFEYVDDIETRIEENYEDIEIVAGAVRQLEEDKEWNIFLSLDKLRRAYGLDRAQYKVWCQLAIKLKARASCPPYSDRKPRSD